MLLKVGDVAWQGVRLVVNQVFGKLALFGIDFCVWRDVERVDDSCNESRLNGVVKKDAVEDGTSVWLEAK